MQNSECVVCRKPKANFECEVCNEMVCKNCSQVLDQSTFSFMEEIPEILSHTHYCSACYDDQVAPEFDKYQEILERAKQVFVFFTTQRKEIPLIRRSKVTFHVKESQDRDETILKLGYFAAKDNYNAITEVNVFAEKVRNGSYQTSTWQGSGIPALVDAVKMERQDQVNQMYR